MIIDTLLFSEPHEQDLLYLKLLLEHSYVDYWIIQENSYTTQGEYKGVFAKEIIQQERFFPFKNKIIICSANEQNGIENNENVNFMRERWQRSICLKVLEQLANGNDTIIISDVDELIDFSDNKRTERFFHILDTYKNVPNFIGRMRYWYDYDNRCYINGLMIPTIPYNILQQNPFLISQLRLINNTNPQSTKPIYCGGVMMHNAQENPICFEYSYVFKSIDDIWRKKTTFAHNNYTYDCIKIALECNHFPYSTLRGDNPPGSHSHDWLEKVELNETNSPKYVRDNIKELKTNIVNTNYKENRIKTYGKN